MRLNLLQNKIETGNLLCLVELVKEEASRIGNSNNSWTTFFYCIHTCTDTRTCIFNININSIKLTETFQCIHSLGTLNAKAKGPTRTNFKEIKIFSMTRPTTTLRNRVERSYNQLRIIWAEMCKKQRTEVCNDLRAATGEQCVNKEQLCVRVWVLIYMKRHIKWPAIKYS